MRAISTICALCCISIIGCRSASLSDALAQGQKSGICPVHHLKMVMNAVPLGHGFYVGPSDGPGTKFTESHFPFAQWFAMDGGPVIIGSSKSAIELYHCPDCEKAKLDWIARHPEGEWSKVEIASYERISRLRLGERPNPSSLPTPALVAPATKGP